MALISPIFSRNYAGSILRCSCEGTRIVVCYLRMGSWGKKIIIALISISHVTALGAADTGGAVERKKAKAFEIFEVKTLSSLPTAKEQYLNFRACEECQGGGVFPIFGNLLPSAVPANFPWEAYRRLTKTFVEQSVNSNTPKRISNFKFMTIVDYTQDSASSRFFVIDVTDPNLPKVDSYKASHGEEDLKISGKYYAKYFSIRKDTNVPAVGFFITEGKNRGYDKSHPSQGSYRICIDGIEKMNGNSCDERGLLVHGAPYVKETEKVRNGQSDGCAAVDPTKAKTIVERIVGGSLFYVFHPEAEDHLRGYKMFEDL